jgi:hypothetical protein
LACRGAGSATQARCPPPDTQSALTRYAGSEPPDFPKDLDQFQKTGAEALYF